MGDTQTDHIAETTENEVSGKTHSSRKKQSIWSAAFVSLLIINFFNSMAQMMMNTLIPLYAYSLGAPASIVGIVTSSFAITALLCRPLVGPAFDAFNKKWILFGSIVVTAIAVFLYGRMTTVPGLIFARLLHGVAMSCNGPVALAMVSNSLPYEKLGSGISIFSLVTALCMAIGPALGLWMAGVMSYTFVFTLSAGVYCISLVCIAFLKEPGEQVRKPYKFAPSRMFAKNAFIPASITCILCMAASCIGSFIAIYGGLRGVGNIGFYFTFNAIALLATRPFYGWAADKYGFNRVIVPGLIAFAVAFILIHNATTLPQFVAAGVVNAFGFGAVAPLIQALSIQCVPVDQRGSASNTHFTGTDSGMLLGPLVGGVVVDALQTSGMAEVSAYSTLYLCALIPMAVAAIIYFVFRKKLDILKQQAREADLQRALAGKDEYGADDE